MSSVLYLSPFFSPSPPPLLFSGYFPSRLFSQTPFGAFVLLFPRLVDRNLYSLCNDALLYYLHFSRCSPTLAPPLRLILSTPLSQLLRLFPFDFPPQIFEENSLPRFFFTFFCDRLFLFISLSLLLLSHSVIPVS